MHYPKRRRGFFFRQYKGSLPAADQLKERQFNKQWRLFLEKGTAFIPSFPQLSGEY